MRSPDLVGVARAWRIEQTPKQVKAHEDEWGHPPASLGPSWLICGPYHPFWSWWYVGLISLRELPGLPSAKKQYPEAEYELMFLSLNPNPEAPRTYPPDIERVESGDLDGLPGFLSPPDLCFHFDGVNESQAVEIMALAVERIVAGQSCDSDFRSWWQTSLRATIEHYQDGRHESEPRDQGRAGSPANEAGGSE